MNLTNQVDIGSFPAMTLWNHLVWGLSFTKIFGFSFTVLRFSTLVSSLRRIFVLNKLLVALQEADKRYLSCV